MGRRLSSIVYTLGLATVLTHQIGGTSAAVYAPAPVRGVNLGGWFVLEPWYVHSSSLSTEAKKLISTA